MKVPFKLCLITNRHLVKNKPLIEICQKALEGGVDCIILREPDLNAKTLTYVAKQFRMLTSRYGAKLVIRDRVDVAMTVNADGVQLGADSIPPEDVRKIWKGLIGYSAHGLEEIEKLHAKVDYFLLSPIFHTKSKPLAKPLGVEYLKQAVKLSKVPVYALGGVNQENIKDVMEACAAGAAVMSLFFGTQDPKDVATSLIETVEGCRNDPA